MDQNKHGTIALWELKDALQGKFCIPDEETQKIFDALDFDRDAEVQYSDFLAAMLNSSVVLHDGLLQNAFNRFDTDHSGAITADDVRWVLGGDAFDGEKVEKLIGEADHAHPGRITYPEFVAYLRGGSAATEVVQGEAVDPGACNSTEVQGAALDAEAHEGKEIVQGSLVFRPAETSRPAPVAGADPTCTPLS
mmetsp:Transcript_103349/g.308749  ORF Transcript_103349/g.308749 Transcript_103349/m.308749 type:complete len:193 (-) Transcript_103349:47-625(-)